MQMPGVGIEEMVAVVSGTLLTSMVAEQAGSSGNLRGSELAQALSYAASMAGGDVFKEPENPEQQGNLQALEVLMIKESARISKNQHAGLSKDAIALAGSLAAKVIGAVCKKRNKMHTEKTGERTGQAEQDDDEQDGNSE